MSVDIAQLSVLCEPAVRNVFNEVVKRRTVQLGELVRLGRGGATRAGTRQLLDKLKDARLIAEQPSTLDEFSTYYVTADGLEADRKLR